MTERNQVNTTARRYLAPYGRWLRFEHRYESDWPDVIYTLRGVTGFVECKVVPASGRCPEHFTLGQLQWGEAEVAAGGRWHLLALRTSQPAEWWLLGAVEARAWFEGREFEPCVRVSGRFPLREVLDRIAPLPARLVPILYMITEPEMQGLLDQLHLTEMIDKNYVIGGTSVDDRRQRYESLSPDEKNRLNSVHRAFHMICVRWAQEMGFKGGRF